MREFSKRRKELSQILPSGSAVIIPSAAPSVRNGDIEYPFRQNSHFFYLTGFPESEAIAVLIPNKSAYRYFLFCEPHDPERDVWEGKRIGCAGAVKHYGAEKAYPIKEFEEVFPSLIKDCQSIYWMGNEQQGETWLPHLKRLSAAAGRVHEFQSVDVLIDEMRVRKSKMELSLMKKAADIAAQAHCEAMRMCRPGCYEYEIEAVLIGSFRSADAVPAYPSIVGGGANACTLHYIKNDTPLKDGDLLLVDAGAEYQHYASDITRTYPVNGQFTSLQKELYEVVLEAQTLAIKKVKAGNYVNDFHVAAVHSLTRGLVNLGLLKGNVKDLLRNQAYRKFYMHNTGHWIGMDVHDPSSYRLSNQWRRLETGMVVTVEPGLYIRPARDVAKRWWNIGIRIEDDVVVGSHGAEVISAAVPKAPDEIESLMAQ